MWLRTSVTIYFCSSKGFEARIEFVVAFLYYDANLACNDDNLLIHSGQLSFHIRIAGIVGYLNGFLDVAFFSKDFD